MPSPRWQKGTSGNPGGRPALDPALKAKLAALTPRAIERLAEALDGDDPKLAVTAAMALLDRSLGRPPTSAELTVRNAASLAFSSGSRAGWPSGLPEVPFGQRGLGMNMSIAHIPANG